MKTRFSFLARTALAAATLAFLPAIACAQTPPGVVAPAQPRLGQAGKDVMWLPSPDAAVDRMLQMTGVQSSDLVVDLGSGDGKISIAAARSYGARSLGLEYNPSLVAVATQRAAQAGVADRVQFRQADIFATDFSSATVVTMYLLPELNLRLRPVLFAMRPGTRVVSHSFDMGDWAPDEVAQIGTARVSAWTIPANAAGEWDIALAPVPTGAAPLPTRLRLRQKLQVLEGEATFGAIQAGLMRARLAGPSVQFEVRAAAGEVLRFQGRIDGDRLSGSYAQEGRAAVPFAAVRTTPAQAIDGVAASEPEIQRAHRVLDSAS